MSNAKKYLSFSLSHETYGVEVSLVKEILAWKPSIPIPRCHQWVQGIIDLRGKIVPVLDLKYRMGMEKSKVSKTTCIVVVELTGLEEKFLLGFVVDSVLEVILVEDEHREDCPMFGEGFDQEYVESVIRINSEVKTLLNLNKVFGAEDLIFKEASL